MRADFINPFLHSLLNVLYTMADLQIEPEKASLKKSNYAQGDVSGIIGLIGPQTQGSFSITFEESLALEIMYRLVKEKPSMINTDVADMVGEITNMVSGGAKRILSEAGFEFEMATPVVVTGSGHRILHKNEGQIIIMPFESEYGRVFIEICFD